MPTANESLFDLALRRQVDLRRFTKAEVKAILDLLSRADRDFVAKLRERLGRLGVVTDFTSQRWQLLLSEIRALRRAVLDAAERRVTDTMNRLGHVEADAELKNLRHAVPIQFEFATVPVETIRAIVAQEPIVGARLKEWFDELRVKDQRALTRTLQVGLAQGESVPDLVKRVAGTRANGYADGALSIARRDAEAVVRTAANHVSNSARESVWEANSDVVTALRWTSVLDGRTTPICQSRDGKLTPVGDNELPQDADALDPPDARPPAHVNCRSVMVPVLDGEALVGDRPFVVSAKRPDVREADFEAEAAATGRSVAAVRRDWADENIGQTPAETTYQEWLGKQPAAFQDEVLGPTRGKLFRDGGLQLDEFVNRRGDELTLDQLKARHPSAFDAVGV